MIQKAGIVRLGDLFQLLPDWNMSSIDGYSWQVSPQGLAPLQNQSYLLFLDGHKIDLQFVDFNHLNMLPVILSTIDYIEVTATPHLSEGEFVDRGIIHIHTNEPPEQFTATGEILLGNETGDPGPYLFTKYATTNVDRSAFDGSLSLSWRNTAGYVRGTLLVQHHPSTDVAMLARNTAMVNDWPGLYRSIMPSLAMGFSALGATHELSTGYPSTYRYFYYFEPLGREIAVNSQLPRIGLRGDLPLSAGRMIRYRIGASRHKLELHEDAQIQEFQWRTNHIQTNLEAIRQNLHSQVHIGIAWDRYGNESDKPLDKRAYNLYKLFGMINRQPLSRFGQTLAATVVTNGKNAALKGALGLRWGTGNQRSVSINLSISQRLFEEDNSFWFWIRQGSDILESNGINHSTLEDFNQSTQVTSDLKLVLPLNREIIIETVGYHRALSGQYWMTQDFIFNPADYSVSSPVEIHSDSKGQVMGLRCSAKYSPTDQVNHRLSVVYQGTRAGDALFMEQWETIPKYRANYQITYTPHKSFSVWVMIRMAASISWPDYRGIDGQVYYSHFEGDLAYASTTPPYTNIDLKFQKSFLSRRIVGSILFRNILNQEVRYHPFGASFEFSLLLQVRVLI
ncbi:MAG: hypothetical protein V3W14_09260 [Candidatus Neomarinimicrobiota bacterium]